MKIKEKEMEHTYTCLWCGHTFTRASKRGITMQISCPDCGNFIPANL